MKHLTFLTITLLTLYAHGQVPNSNISADKNLYNNAATFRLYPTQNMWTFIKLNTRNGLICQVQFDVKSNNRSVTDLNFIPIVAKEEEADDRFILYSTQNMYNFILLDQHDGRTWQVQWSLEAANRGIIQIQ